MNFSIALHPGLEKTGTSSIQKFFRINANNYIGIPEKLQLVAGRHFLTKYRYVVLNKAPSWWFTKEGQKLLHQFENAFTKALNINPNQILISFENLLSHDYFLGTNKWIRSNSNETWTPVDHLKTLIDCTVLCEGSIKFLITVRRQSDWLASLYAQRSNLIRRANQSDFEEKISQILKMSPIPAPLNLNMLISEIEKKINPSEIIVLPLELISDVEYSQEIEKWLSPQTVPFLSEFLGKLNARRIDTFTWALRPRLSRLGKIFPIYRIISEKLRTSRFPSFRGQIILNEVLSDEIMDVVNDLNKSILCYAPIGLPGYYKN